MSDTACVREGLNGSISSGFFGGKKSIVPGTEQGRLLKDKTDGATNAG